MAKKIKGWLDGFPQAQMGDTFPLDASQAMSTLSTLGEVFSVPQKTATKLITGKYQAPSEALGITNPYGQFATDAILDPMNIGIAPLSKGTYKAGKALMPIIDDFIYENFKAPKTLDKINAKNIQRELGKRIDKGRGQFNKGVYELKRFQDHAVKFEDPDYVGDAIENQFYTKYDFVEAMKNIPDEANIAKIKKQFLTKDGDNALIMKQIQGVPFDEVAPVQLRKIPEQAIKDLYQNIKTLRNNNLGMDFMGDNVVYDPITKKFGIFDVDPGDVGEYWSRAVHGRMNNQFGQEASAQGIKETIENKLINSYWSSVDRNIIDPAKYNRYLNEEKVEKLLVGGKDFLRDRLQKILGPLDSKQSGGNIPGSVGFTYARTQSPAPSNGKYAKKTMPSAQNGQEMKFYQEGLDWKPKNISRNGKVIEDNLGQWKHPGEITKINSNQITMKGVDYPVLGISNTGDTQMMFPNQEYSYEGDFVTEYPMAQKGKTIKPLYVSNPNDPRLKSYKDSLSLYNSGLKGAARLSKQYPDEKFRSINYSSKYDRLIAELDNANRLYVEIPNTIKPEKILGKNNRGANYKIPNILTGTDLLNIDATLLYKKPTTPVVYQKPIVKPVVKRPIVATSKQPVQTPINTIVEQPIIDFSQVEKADGSVGMWGNPIDTLVVNKNVPNNPIGKTDHRGVRSGQKYQGSPSTVKAIELKEQQLKAQSSRNHYKNGGWLDQYN